MANNTDRLDQHQREISQILIELARQQQTAEGAKDVIASKFAAIEDALKQMRAELAETGKAVARHDERLKTVEKGSDHPAALASHEQRLKALEKGNDRT